MDVLALAIDVNDYLALSRKYLNTNVTTVPRASWTFDKIVINPSTFRMAMLVRNFVPTTDKAAVHGLFDAFLQQRAGNALGPLHPAVWLHKMRNIAIATY